MASHAAHPSETASFPLWLHPRSATRAPYFRVRKTDDIIEEKSKEKSQRVNEKLLPHDIFSDLPRLMSGPPPTRTE